MSIERNSPYLIQRLGRRTTEGKVSDKRFGEVFSLDYMGAAEFEFGAFPQFLRRMHAAELIPFSVEIHGKKYFGVYDSTMYANVDDVKDVLQGIADGKFRHKEFPNFPPSRTYADGDAWADIRNNLFWSKENLNSSIVQCIANSVVYMDSQKAK